MRRGLSTVVLSTLPLIMLLMSALVRSGVVIGDEQRSIARTGLRIYVSYNVSTNSQA